MDFIANEDQIRGLVAKAISTSDPQELERVIRELRAALKQHIEKTKAMAVSSWCSPPLGDDY